jgi:hypothetical protein
MTAQYLEQTLISGLYGTGFGRPRRSSAFLTGVGNKLSCVDGSRSAWGFVSDQRTNRALCGPLDRQLAILSGGGSADLEYPRGRDEPDASRDFLVGPFRTQAQIFDRPGVEVIAFSE